MKEDDILKSLEDVLAQAGVQLRYEKGDFASGGCRVGDKRMLIVQKGIPAVLKIKILLKEIAQCDTSMVEMAPDIQELIANASEQVED